MLGIKWTHMSNTGPLQFNLSQAEIQSTGTKYVTSSKYYYWLVITYVYNYRSDWINSLKDLAGVYVIRISAVGYDMFDMLYYI